MIAAFGPLVANKLAARLIWAGPPSRASDCTVALFALVSAFVELICLVVMVVGSTWSFHSSVTVGVRVLSCCRSRFVLGGVHVAVRDALTPY